MLVVPELEREVELLWELRDMRKVSLEAVVLAKYLLQQCSSRSRMSSLAEKVCSSLRMLISFL